MLTTLSVRMEILSLFLGVLFDENHSRKSIEKSWHFEQFGISKFGARISTLLRKKSKNNIVIVDINRILFSDNRLIHFCVQ